MSEIKRHLFEAYMRPRETFINLTSTSTSSSASFPGGEAFHFSFSPSSHHLLAYTSSRIYVVDTKATEPRVTRELKISRRPASTAILDDGTLLAVLSTDHQVDIYDLKSSPPKHVRAIALDHAPRTIALSPTGTVLAAAYVGGIEVYPLSSTAALTTRRVVKCNGVDSLSFSLDGTQLLGTTIRSKDPSTVILTAPYYSPVESLTEDPTSQLWTTSILFPNSTRDCSHAVLLPSSLDEQGSWAFTYDRVFETFRAVRIDDLRNGTTYFTGPESGTDTSMKLLPSTLPAASAFGEMVAAGFRSEELWIYGIPRDLDTSPGSTPSNKEGGNVPSINVARMNSSGSSRSYDRQSDGTDGNRIPQWQLLTEKSRNKFVQGRKVCHLDAINAVRWITDSPCQPCGERLIAVAPGVTGQHMEFDEGGIPPVDGGRIIILDFSYSTENGSKRKLVIEVGDNEPEILEEERRDLETEVAIFRRRTVAQRRGEHSNPSRAAAGATNALVGSIGMSPTIAHVPVLPALPSLSSTNVSQITSADNQSEIASVDDDVESLDTPYVHDGPRSGGTLRRAATAAAMTRRFRPRRVVPPEHLHYRRADGREEHPHESDADNWVPPPPPYSKDAMILLPEHLRNAVMAESLPAVQSSGLHRSATQRTTDSGYSDIINSLQRSRTTYLPRDGLRRAQSTEAITLTNTNDFSLTTDDITVDRAVSPELGPDVSDFDDLYDVSPPGTPELERVDLSVSDTMRQSLNRSVPAVISPNISPQTTASAAENIPVIVDISLYTSTEVSASPIMERSISATSSDKKIPENIPENIPDEGVLEEDLLENIPEDKAPEEKMPEEKLPGEKALAEKVPEESMAHEQAVPPITEARLQAPVPRRLIEYHRLSELPPLPPDTSQTRPKDIDAMATTSQVAYVQGRQDYPVPVRSSSPEEQPSGGYAMPSASQLARLNSRSGRPQSRIFTDPSRRHSGTFMQPHGVRYQPESPPARGLSQESDMPPHIKGTDEQLDNRTDSKSRIYEPQSRLARPRYGPTPASNFRPQVNRLETIHSIVLPGESAASVQRSRSQIGRSWSQIGVRRNQSRVERKPSISMQQSKRNGWRGSRKVRKDRNKGRDGAAAAEGSDVPVRRGTVRRREKKDTKCVVM